MADSVGKMAWIVSGDISGLSSAMRRGSVEVRSFASEAKQQFQGLAGALQGMSGFGGLGQALSLGVGIASAQGLTIATKGLFNALYEAGQEMHSLVRSSKELEVGIEELEHFGNAGKRAGLAFEETLEILEKTELLIGRAHMGDPKAVEFMEKLHLDAEALENMDPGAATRTIVDALDMLPDKYQRAAVAAEGYSKKWADLVKLADELHGKDMMPVVSEASVKNLAMFWQQTQTGVAIYGKEALGGIAAAWMGAADLMAGPIRVAMGKKFFVAPEDMPFAKPRGKEDLEGQRAAFAEQEKFNREINAGMEVWEKEIDAAEKVKKMIQGATIAASGLIAQTNEADRARARFHEEFDDKGLSKGVMAAADAQFGALSRQIDAAKELKELEKEAAEAKKQSLSIEDKYAEAVANAVKFRHAGLISQQDEARMVTKANHDLAEHWKQQATAQRSRAPELAYAGSAEASRIRAEAMSHGRSEQEQQLRLQQAIAQHGGQAVQLLTQIANRRFTIADAN
jgi:hypothetical protein